ncbi:ImmA/IrrE family metallo-endopeptidase [Lactiplantibacillus paraplantarum]|uniref:ImmA/IrrE family metallo-endopeptidase n=1 Tax=Lactiplantibacillus paraplantarum TaxID=60520 RepID=A0AAD0TNC5_9LACO|nr:toxin [Lactiplantibacillus paraplantarum]AYJ38161.1 ImmA/IrrE family metallo-endopeptidase [Lactiplantibacillus paraplantarum]GEO61004.1 hypothetical protein LPA07_13250 [Lactiplantibacillus paraplantarum]
MIDYFREVLDYVFDHGIGITLCGDFSSHTPSGSNPHNRQIVINTKWYKQRQLPYITAHEASHVLNQDSGVLYYSGTAKTPIEAKANRGAIDILIPIYFQDMEREFADQYTFMEEFEVPSFMEDYVISKIREYYAN